MEKTQNNISYDHQYSNMNYWCLLLWFFGTVFVQIVCIAKRKVLVCLLATKDDYASDLKAKWETDRLMHDNSKSEAEKKCNEINEQAETEIFLLKLEKFQLQAQAETEISVLKQAIFRLQTQAETEISLLKREKFQLQAQAETEISLLKQAIFRLQTQAETEISLLKLAKFRLQTQLDNAMTAETSQASLRAERDEEFKSLKLQVNLLRESNAQLREDNKLKVDECQKLRETSQKSRTEIKDLETILAVKENDVTALKKEKEHLERRVDELLERWQNISVEELDRMKVRVQHMQALKVPEVSGAIAGMNIYNGYQGKVIVLEIKDDSALSVRIHEILCQASTMLVDHTVLFSVRASEINRLEDSLREKQPGIMLIHNRDRLRWMDAQFLSQMDAKILAATINSLVSFILSQ